MYMYNLNNHDHVYTYIIPSQLDESGEISIDKLTAYKTDLEYLDDHFQVHTYVHFRGYNKPHPSHAPQVQLNYVNICCI